ncbi:hypothetical protein TNCV_3493481 [Trichonephila clavipes]|nr:hypothetical protein TNCV_3493481 [Trichonephila clavipes]
MQLEQRPYQPYYLQTPYLPYGNYNMPFLHQNEVQQPQNVVMGSQRRKRRVRNKNKLSGSKANFKVPGPYSSENSNETPVNGEGNVYAINNEAFGVPQDNWNNSDNSIYSSYGYFKNSELTCTSVCDSVPVQNCPVSIESLLSNYKKNDYSNHDIINSYINQQGKLSPDQIRLYCCNNVTVKTKAKDGVENLFFSQTSQARTSTAGSDVVQSGRPIFDDFFQHLWPYIDNNTANVVFQMVKRLWLIRIDQ